MHPLPIVSDLEKVQATLKQLVRDWSSEGARERQMCYQPIIDEVLKNFPTDAWSVLKKQKPLHSQVVSIQHTFSMYSTSFFFFFLLAVTQKKLKF